MRTGGSGKRRILRDEMWRATPEIFALVSLRQKFSRLADADARHLKNSFVLKNASFFSQFISMSTVAGHHRRYAASVKISFFWMKSDY